MGAGNGFRINLYIELGLPARCAADRQRYVIPGDDDSRGREIIRALDIAVQDQLLDAALERHRLAS